MSVPIASGKMWYGEEHLFGPRTKYEKADERFNFTISGQQVLGYTLQLIDQQGGNLKKVKMKADEF